MPFHGSASSASVVATWWPTRSVGLRPSEVATAPNSPPSISVALVKTTVLSVSSLSRIGPHTCRGATWSRAGKRSRASPSHSTSAWEPAAIRSALTKTSCTIPLAWVRPASASPSPPDSRGNADRHARAASRTSTRASESWVDTWSMRPGGVASIASASCCAASSRSPAGSPSPSVQRMARRAARSMSDTPSSSVAAWVTRAVSSWASSMTTVS